MLDWPMLRGWALVMVRYSQIGAGNDLAYPRTPYGINKARIMPKS